MSEISVCIPTYEFNGNGVKFLSELFCSISNQTFKDFNIVISDHSKDNNIFEYCKNVEYDFDITYLKNPNGRGYQSSNTNCCINNATGRIIKLIYQDDMFVDCNALEKIKEAFDNTNSKWLMHGFTHTIDGIETHRDCIPIWTEMMLEGNNNLGSPSCVCFLKDYVLEMDENLKLLIDTELYHRMRINYGLPVILEDVLIANREHENRVSSNQIVYDMALKSPSGKMWMVNSKEVDYIYNKHRNFFVGGRKYPDEI